VRQHPHLYEINTWPWLEAQSRRAGRTITLGGVADEEWNRLRDLGIDVVYLMGVWRRSRIGRDIARAEPALFRAYDEAVPGWHVRDVVGSAFCVSEYVPDQRMGSWDELDAVRSKLHDRGMRLLVDFIPNHTGFDHPWITDHPDRYVNAPEDAFRRSPGEFRAVELPSGDVRFIACARDPFFPPWTDAAQLNYANLQTRAAMIETLRFIARHADGARCDMAMLVLSDVFSRTWSELTGPAPDDEFWREALAGVPGFLLLAEVYWNLEWRLQQLGFDFTYDKTLYDRLLHGSGGEVRAHLTGDLEYQRRSARFIENHDEARSASAFGDRVRVAAVVVSTLPGMRFYHDGQFEGRRAHVPVQLGASGEEPADERLVAFYDRILRAANDPVYHTGEWRLYDLSGWDETARDLVAWRWKLEDDLRIVVVNLGVVTGQGLLHVKGDLPPGDAFTFVDLLDGTPYRWAARDLTSSGLYVRLAPAQAHVFRVAL
jgi:hypothetical protein